MQYTDRFGSPLSVGDRIVVALAAGRGGAKLFETRVAGLVPLVPHRDKTEPRRAYVPAPKGSPFNTRGSRMGEIEGFYYMRVDQDRNSRPTEFYKSKDTTPDKLFVLQYEKRNFSGDYTGAKQAFDRVEDVVKVPVCD
jgi:hypothetical protein